MVFTCLLSVLKLEYRTKRRASLALTHPHYAYLAYLCCIYAVQPYSRTDTGASAGWQETKIDSIPKCISDFIAIMFVLNALSILFRFSISRFINCELNLAAILGFNFVFVANLRSLFNIYHRIQP